jgi:hypothetical protein
LVGHSDDRSPRQSCGAGLSRVGRLRNTCPIG